MDIVVMIGTAGATRVAGRTLAAEDEGGATTAEAEATIVRVEKAAPSTVAPAARMIAALAKNAVAAMSGTIATAVSAMRADSAAIAAMSLEGRQAAVGTDPITAGMTTTAASMVRRIMAAGARTASSTRRIVSFETEAAATSAGIETTGSRVVKAAGSGVLRPTR
jgi:hypothetical protein